MQPSVAIITTVYNEDVLLPIWLRYYGAQFGREHLYVIDDGSNDGSTIGLEGVNVIRLERAPIDQDNRSLAMSLFHEQMLKHYDVVIFSDVDEFLVPDPLTKLGLFDYIARHTGAHTNAIGFDVIHNQFAEPSYTHESGVFAQRRYLQFSRAYCKQLIHREPVIWLPGFHNSNHKPLLGVGLYLFHLRSLDYELSRKRINNRNKLPWSERSISKGHGEQNRLSEAEYLSKFFLTRPDFEGAVPESAFNPLVTKVADLIPKLVIWDQVFFDLGRTVLSLPARFRDTLPAVLDAGVSDAQRGPARVSAADARALYFAARDRIEREGLVYLTAKEPEKPAG